MKRAEVKKELDKIRTKSPDGRLHAEDVVKMAKKEGHPLHGMFTWDDGKAAEQYRLMQARQLIRSVRVSNPEDAFRAPRPAYIALKSDLPQGGYRTIDEIVGDDELRESLHETAITELRGWVKRYRALESLAGAVADAAGIELTEAITA